MNDQQQQIINDRSWHQASTTTAQYNSSGKLTPFLNLFVGGANNDDTISKLYICCKRLGCQLVVSCTNQPGTTQVICHKNATRYHLLKEQSKCLEGNIEKDDSNFFFDFFFSNILSIRAAAIQFWWRNGPFLRHLKERFWFGSCSLVGERRRDE